MLNLNRLKILSVIKRLILIWALLVAAFALTNFIKNRSIDEKLRMEAGGSSLPSCEGPYSIKWTNCFGVYSGAGGRSIGEMVNGKLNGQGKISFDDGTSYIGTFKDDIRNGYGTQIYKNGDKYEGEWKDNQEHGWGTYYNLADNALKGSKHVGENKNREANGPGTFYYPDGNIYIGEFKGNKRNGKGTLTYGNGKPPESGNWSNDKYIGERKGR